jgi:hypothetical protein
LHGFLSERIPFDKLPWVRLIVQEWENQPCPDFEERSIMKELTTLEVFSDYV